MNQTVLDFIRRRLPADTVKGRRVLEVGSYDVNGSPRSVVGPLGPSGYVGVDIQAGPGVDMTCDATALEAAFGRDSFDLVISTEMVEHLEDWRGAVRQMKAVLKPGGRLLITTRSPGFPYHPHPVDCWRFTKEDFARIFGDMEIEEICDDPKEPGVFGCFVKRAGSGPGSLAEVAVARAPRP